MNAIEVSHISKSYGKVKALKDVSFSVGKGEVFGLIGPDGAGKTSMFRILCTLLLPDKGTATVDGFDVVKQMTDIRKRVGYMPGIMWNRLVLFEIRKSLRISYQKLVQNLKWTRQIQ